MGRPFFNLVCVLAPALSLVAGGLEAQTSGVLVTLSTSSNSLQPGQTASLTALVTGAVLTTVTWSLSPQLGTLGAGTQPTAGGKSTNTYTAPATSTAGQTVTITATSQQDTSASASVIIAIAPPIGIGTGAPPALQYLFEQAFYRNGFSTMVSLPPSGAVTTLGSSGYIQLFADAAKSATVWALASQSATTAASTGGVVQIWGGMYSYFNSLGVNTVGYPLYDTANCGTVQGSNCLTQTFDKGYALFYYSPALAAGSNLNVSGVFYTLWIKLGGTSSPGPPLTAQTAITAPTGTTATVQTYVSGAIYSITSGVNKGQVFGVTEPLYDFYVSNGGPTGNLGLPTNQFVTLATGVLQQSFEGGTLQYTPGVGPIVLLPVASVVLTGAPSVAAGTSITLNLGQTLTVTATPYDTSGAAATGRAVSWSTSNGKVIAVAASGGMAVLTAAGAGSATVYATAGGISSARLSFVVVAPCCQVGDGAPTTVALAFLAALARTQLSVTLPVADPATRAGNGYVQTVESSGGGVYLIAEADQSGTAYVVGGAVLARYQALGGPAGALGYPASGQSAGGTQLFANAAALAGSPVRLVSGGVLNKWAALGYETGAAGPPVADAAGFATFAASSGAAQSFASGDIYAAAAGPHAGQAYFVSGLVLAAFNSSGGAAGALGMPVTDPFASGVMVQQNFEGGNITYTPGDAAAKVNLSPRSPTITVAPAAITAGGTAQIAVYGFANGATLQVSITGQPGFTVTAANGAYAWSMFVPLAASSGTLAIHAADAHGTATADGSLTIRGFNNNRVPLAKVQGDNQTGPPGAMLPVPLQVLVADASGNPVAGVPVTFEASPGAQVSATGAVTDGNGHASAYLRLPPAAGVAEVTVNAPSVAQAPVTFGAVASAQKLANFPNLQENGSALLGAGPATIGQKGALLTAVASILAYHQNRGELPSPNGAATPAALNQFLTSYCVAGTQLCDGFLSGSAGGEQIVNLWRAAEFTGGVDVEVLNPSLATVADWLAQGEPLLLSLGLTLNGAGMGGSFVVATGVAGDGSIVIQDPNPLFARTNWNDYLNGFSVGAGMWRGSLLGVVRLALESPSATRFLVGALSQPASLMRNFTMAVTSVAGACGLPLTLLDTVDAAGNAAAGGGLVSRLEVCDGLQPAYQIDLGAAQSYRAFITDLAAGGVSTDVSGSAPATYGATRPLLSLALAPQSAVFTAGGVVNVATFTAGIAPGGLVAIFGSGLSGAGAPTTVDFDGTAATVLAATPFQVNAQVPPSIAPGVHTLRVRSGFGSAQQAVTVSPLAPAIFLVGNPPAGAVENQDGSLNGATNPLPRGQVLVVYATGLGAVTAGTNGLSTTNTAVTVLVNGTELPAAYAGLAPGYIGLYQVNVVIPTSTPPGSGISLTLKEGGQLSNAINVALQ